MAKTEKTTKAKTEKAADLQEGKLKAIQTAMGQIEKKYGKGSIMKLGENSVMNVSAISTGSLSLDLALGIGGVPRGRIIEIYGPESSGKTTVALQVIASAQKAGGAAAFIDAEHALDPVYAKALGVDIDNLLVSQPDSGEQALEIAEALDNLDAYETQALEAFLDNGDSYAEALEHISNCDYMIYFNCNDMADVAEEYANETGLLDSIPENLRYYFDFAAYGRDMGFEGHFYFNDHGNCIQLLY